MPGFDPDKYLQEKSGGFDPDQYLAEKAPVESQTRQMNFTPDSGPTPEQDVALRQSMKEQGEFVPPVDLQKAIEPIAAGAVGGATSDIVAPSQEMLQESPGKVLTGEVIGGTAQSLMLPAKKIVDMGAGAVQGYNDTQGDVGQKILGGLFGAVVGLAGNLVGKVGGKLVRSLSEAPEKSAQKALGLTQGDLVRLSQKGRKYVGESVKDVTDTLKNAGIFNKGASPQAIESSLHGIRENAGQQLDNLFQELDATGHVIPSAELSTKIDEQLDKLNEFPEAFGDKISRLQAFQKDLSLNPVVGASKLRTLTQTVADEAFDAQGKVVDEEAFKVWQSLKDATDEVANRVGGDLGAQIKQANKTYSAAQKALPAVARKVAKEEAAPTLRLLSQPLKGSAQLAEQTVQESLVDLPKWVQNNASKLGKFAPVLQSAMSRGTQATAAMFYRLSQQYPEFREKVKELQSGE